MDFLEVINLYCNMKIIFIFSSLVSIIFRIAFLSILVVHFGKHNDLLTYF